MKKAGSFLEQLTGSKSLEKQFRRGVKEKKAKGGRRGVV